MQLQGWKHNKQKRVLEDVRYLESGALKGFNEKKE